jgi:hydroxymethylpyrimidine pyrophosphatase-like HAD family hydrolase
MKFDVLATDYDGTIAYDGVVDDATVEALMRARDASLRLVLVTGRELTDLFRTFPHPALFDLIVAENGAVLYHPATQTVDVIASSPPSALLDRLKKDHVPLSVGHSIVATVEPYEHKVLTAIRDLGLEWHVIFNKGSVMALPAEVTKATGLAAALALLEVPHERVIGIGDAENDQAFLRACGLAVAVANALPAVKQTAHIVTDGARGSGVREVIDRAIAGDLPDVLTQLPAHAVVPPPPSQDASARPKS